MELGGDPTINSFAEEDGIQMPGQPGQGQTTPPGEENSGGETPGEDTVSFSEHFKPLGFENLEGVKKKLTVVKDLDDETITQLPDIRERAGKYEATKKALEDQQKKFESFNPYEGDENLYRYYEIKKKNPDEAEFFKRFVLGKGEPLDVIKANLIKKFPSLKDNPEHLDRKIKRMYPALYETNEDGKIDTSSEAYQAAIDDMKLDAEEITLDFQNQFKDIQMPKPKTQEEIDAQKTETLSKWSPVFDGIKKDFTSLDINVTNDDKKTEKVFDLKVQPKELEPYIAYAQNYVASQNLANDEKSQAVVKNMVRNAYIMNNFQNIMTNVFKHVSDKVQMEFTDLVFNSKPPKSDADPGQQQRGGKDAETKAFDHIMNNM